jgi:hypothetical protein
MLNKKEKMDNKNCSVCNNYLPVNNFRKIKRKNWEGLYPQCKNCEKLKMKNRYIKNPISQMLSNAKIRAKKKNVPFNINAEYLKKIFPLDNKCPILNVEFQTGYINNNKKNKDFSPSLDRIIPEKGYVEGNLLIVCDIVNRIKSNSSVEMIKKVLNYYSKTEWLTKH